MAELHSRQRLMQSIIVSSLLITAILITSFVLTDTNLASNYSAKNLPPPIFSVRTGSAGIC